jgi:hypothetical protein
LWQLQLKLQPEDGNNEAVSKIVYAIENHCFGYILFNGFAVLAQTKEEQTIKEIYKSSLTNSKCYAWLDDPIIGSRLSGSAGAEFYIQKHN